MGPEEAVVAGSAQFVDAVLPMFTERLGIAPRVADSPLLAAALCQGGAHLLVYEHGGREWLALGADVRRAAGPDLVIVVALPPEHAADVAPISAAASAVVAWRGEPRPVLDAVNRVVAARAAPQPSRRAGPVLTPQPSPALRPAPTPGVRAAPTPPRPAVTPAARAAPTPRPPPPVEDPFEGIFDDAEEAGTPASAPAPAPVPLAAAPAAPPPTAPPATAVWPATVLAAADGLGIVRAALSGLWPEPRLRPTTERVVAGLSTAERAAALGQKLPFDAAPVRRAVGLRWQVAAALDTLPPQGAPVDQPAIQAILGGIDEVLGTLKDLSDDAAPEALRALETVRHALVKEAIDLTEALQSVASAEVVEEITTSRKARRAAATPVARVTVMAPAAAPERRSTPWGLVALLVLAVAGAAAYHGYRYVALSRPVPPPVTGAPLGSVGASAGKAKVVVTPAGQAVDRREVETFRNLERAKGNEVQEISPGTFVVRPAQPAPKQEGATP